MPQSQSTSSANQDFTLFDDRPLRSSRGNRPAQHPPPTRTDNNDSALFNNLAVHTSLPNLSNVQQGVYTPNRNYWSQQPEPLGQQQQRRPTSQPKQLHPLRHSFTAYESNTLGGSHSVTMTKDNLMDFGDASAIAFGDEQLSFDSTVNDNDMHEMSANRFTPINAAGNGNSTIPETVSPADLLYGEFSGSMPGSNSFTNLTTPSMLDDTSPFLTDSANVSPNFEFGEFGGSNMHDDSVPLFPGNDFDALASSMSAQSNNDFLTSPMDAGNGAPMSRSTSTRSIPDTPHSASGYTKADLLRHRLSLNAGVGKSSRRASKALGPIEVDEGDEKAVKRAKNTMAARKSRQKKKDELDVLESKLLEMVEERDYWKMLAVRYGAPVPENN